MPVWPEARCPAVSEEAEVMTFRWQTRQRGQLCKINIFYDDGRTANSDLEGEAGAVVVGRRGAWGRSEAD